MKNSRKQAVTTISNPDLRLCFRCKKPGHLKKDSTELPYCSKCRARGHVPVKCPTKLQHNSDQDERHENYNRRPDERNETWREEWKKSQDQPQFSNKQNRCLTCASDHNTHNCPTRQQPQATATSNHTSSSGIHNNSPINTNHNSSPQQHSHNSQSTVGALTPTLMVNNLPDQTNFQGQHQHHLPQISPLNQQIHSQQISQQFNQQFQQPTAHEASPSVTQPQQYILTFHYHIFQSTPQIVHLWTVMKICLPESFTGRWIWQSDKKGVTRNEKSEKNARRN